MTCGIALNKANSVFPGGQVHLKLDEAGQVSKTGDSEMIFSVTTRQNHQLQPEVFGRRTWRHDLQIFHFKPEWKRTLVFYKETFQSLCLANIVWILLLNGTFLGMYVYQASTFATILMSPPYSFQPGWLGYVQLVQVLDSVVMVPILGYGSDLVARSMSTRRNGLFQVRRWPSLPRFCPKCFERKASHKEWGREREHARLTWRQSQPEYRLITLSLPIALAVLGCVLYGQAGAHPDRWHWMTTVAPYNICFFAFLGANLIGITYVVDSFPSKAGPLLLVICAGRGFISFGLSYSTVPLINLTGYDGAMNIFAIISGVIGALAIPVYFLGSRIRLWATNRLWPEVTEG